MKDEKYCSSYLRKVNWFRPLPLQ
uniref:Uncharacterized protein n=1 Tax=Arundo donax TaxID=35708 RepID=A0A0A9GW35_ARUDO